MSHQLFKYFCKAQPNFKFVMRTNLMLHILIILFHHNIRRCKLPRSLYTVSQYCRRPPKQRENFSQPGILLPSGKSINAELLETNISNHELSLKYHKLGFLLPSKLMFLIMNFTLKVNRKIELVIHCLTTLYKQHDMTI